MHIGEEDLYHLASAELEGRILTDAQDERKRHLGECRECYTKFCVYITMLDLTGNGYNQDSLQAKAMNSPKEERTAAGMQDVFLRIYMAGRILSSIQTSDHTSPCWDFMRMPCVASARGAGEHHEEEVYVSRESEYSQIRREGTRLVIQLDEDVFQTELLGVRYEEDGKEIIRRFAYNETTECYEVVIDRSGQDHELTVEIIALET